MNNYPHVSPPYSNSTPFIHHSMPNSQLSNPPYVESSSVWPADEQILSNTSFNYPTIPQPGVPYMYHSSNVVQLPYNPKCGNAPIPSELAYEDIGLQHVSLTEEEADSIFCSLCQCPMIIRIRLNFCFHLVCYDCFQELVNGKVDHCPVCNEPADFGMALHCDDPVVVCSGECISQNLSTSESTSKIPGKAFLSNRSLKCHEMFFHSQINSTNNTLSNEDESLTPEANILSEPSELTEQLEK